MTLLTLAIQGRMSDYLKADARGMAKVHTLTVRTAGKRTKTGIQKQIRAAFTDSARFQNAIKFKSDPLRGYAPDTTVRVYSKARYKGKGTRRQDFDLLEIWTRGDTIHAAGHEWIAIPSNDAPMRSGEGVGRGGAQRQASPRECGIPLVFIKGAKANEAFLVTKARRGEKPILMYTLLLSTTRSARLDPDSVHEASLARVDADFARYWAKEDQLIVDEFGQSLG